MMHDALVIIAGTLVAGLLAVWGAVIYFLLTLGEEEAESE